MNRKEFIKSCGYACLSGVALASIMQSCTTTKYVSGEIKESDLLLPLAEFEIVKKGKTSYRHYLIAQHESLKYPICVYRETDNTYSALLLKCTHQGAELQVFGEQITCPAHGSEFNAKGEVQQGPASTALRQFPTSIAGNQLKISLK